MATITCRSCGVVLDLEYVKKNPFKVCPVCGAPLDKDAADHVFVEAANPSNPNDVQRADARKRLHEDVAVHEKAAKLTPGRLTPA